MLRLTLAQMRRSLGRLSAAAVAIAIGSAFLATTLLAGGVITRTGYDAVTATFGQADVVVREYLSPGQLDAIRALPTVAAADVLAPTSFEVRNGSRSRYPTMLPMPSDPRLGSVTVTHGSAPAVDGEIALPSGTAESLHVAVGDRVTVHYSTMDPGAVSDDNPEGWTQVSEEVVVTGITDDAAHAWSEVGGAGLVTTADALTWADVDSLTELSSLTLVAAQEGVTSTALTESLAAVVDPSSVKTRDEAAAAAISELSDGGNVLVTVVLGFAAVAMLVAALVIANTFQVLVAQRTRTLAMLRCVGATKSQLRRSVLTEATILGAAAALFGLVTGTVLAQVALTVLRRLDLGVPLPSTVQITPAVVLVPLLVGTLVTLLASLVPAREATKVSPVAALRPADAPAVGARAGRIRLACSLLLVFGGAAALVAVSVMSSWGYGQAGLLLGGGMLAGAASFVGVLLGAVFWVPRVVALLGRALASTGTSARIAAANTVRNPRRTAATSTALLIGVTLVVMMSTGAASARTSLRHELDAHYPVDVVLDGTQLGGGLPSDVLPAVLAVPGVREAVEVRTTDIEVDGWRFHVAAPVGGPASVVSDPSLVEPLADGVLLLPKFAASQITGETTAIAQSDVDGADGAHAQAPVQLRAVQSELGGMTALVTGGTLDQLDPDAVTTTVWASLDGTSDPAAVLSDILDAVSSSAVQVSSAAAERASNERLIDTLLGIVIGLLAVAVVIALIGVANTLSLSVLERRRESATLRAIGLSRRQLRWMLALEGMLIAGVGALLGTGLGLLYGWAGSVVVFGNVGEVLLTVPWRDLALVLVVAVGSGLLASVLPGRAAARTSPVAALTVD